MEENNTLDNLSVLAYNIDTRKVITYSTIDGKCYFYNWLDKLDNPIKLRVLKRVKRLFEGNYGDYKKLDSNISEMRFSFGSGYRVYTAEFNNITIILLCAGDKSSQQKDIEKAKECYQDLIERYQL